MLGYVDEDNEPRVWTVMEAFYTGWPGTQKYDPFYFFPSKIAAEAYVEHQRFVKPKNVFTVVELTLNRDYGAEV